MIALENQGGNSSTTSRPCECVLACLSQMVMEFASRHTHELRQDDHQPGANIMTTIAIMPIVPTCVGYSHNIMNNILQCLGTPTSHRSGTAACLRSLSLIHLFA